MSPKASLVDVTFAAAGRRNGKSVIQRQNEWNAKQQYERLAKTFKTGESHNIREHFEHGASVWRVKIAEVRTSPGAYMGKPMFCVTKHFLDGRVEAHTYTSNKDTVEVQMAQAVPVRSKDVTDFGRLDLAVTELVKVMSRYGPDNPPSADQTESIIRSYQNILDWRRQAREKMTAAEGKIDVAADMLKGLL